jgi:hypothetical protein
MVESVMGAFVALLIALIGRRIGGNTVGALAGILWAIHPIRIFIAGLYYRTTDKSLRPLLGLALDLQGKLHLDNLEARRDYAPDYVEGMRLSCNRPNRMIT